ncbi:Putative bacterial antitoxin YdaS [uncultured Caudovirales phage]|uniref:Bacterial antitoxin YdaS n=1 Tax=uncultured Caudovirales phage TaxID=2100421 RepID=A0A6J5KPU3_9CAUD|nr:Putative bacterial antitoxin YdaS [uncultured Caudovirales phage]
MDINVVLKLEFGSLKGFAKALGVTPTSVQRWQREGFPVGRLKQIEAITEGKITREMLRPDLFKGE